MTEQNTQNKFTNVHMLLTHLEEMYNTTSDEKYLRDAVEIWKCRMPIEMYLNFQHHQVKTSLDTIEFAKETIEMAAKAYKEAKEFYEKKEK